jgi:FkbM family methyltransferase
MSVPGPAHDFRAQYGEDRLLAAEFGAERGICIEVGANDGETGSNTYYFERQGWRCLLIEADPELADACRTSRPRSATVNCAVVAPGSPPTVTFSVVRHARGLSSLQLDPRTLRRVGIDASGDAVEEITVVARTLDDVLTEHALPRIDFMTIDVEGHEWGVLQGFDIVRWRPGILIIERNRHFPDARIMRYLRQAGYVYRRTTGVNDWFYAATAAETGSLTYRRNLLLGYYLPRYATAWRALTPEWRATNRAARTVVRNLLGGLGLLELARRARARLRGDAGRKTS